MAPRLGREKTLGLIRRSCLCGEGSSRLLGTSGLTLGTWSNVLRKSKTRTPPKPRSSAENSKTPKNPRNPDGAVVAVAARAAKMVIVPCASRSVTFVPYANSEPNPLLKMGQIAPNILNVKLAVGGKTQGGSRAQSRGTSGESTSSGGGPAAPGAGSCSSKATPQCPIRPPPWPAIFAPRTPSGAPSMEGSTFKRGVRGRQSAYGEGVLCLRPRDVGVKYCPPPSGQITERVLSAPPQGSPKMCNFSAKEAGGNVT